MIPWSLLDRAQVPGGGELRLMRRGAEFSIKLDKNELMNSRLSGYRAGARDHRLRHDQDARAAAVFDRRIGHGLHACARRLPCSDPRREITVAELVPAVVAWARGPLAEIFGDSLTDPRVSIREADVGDLIRAGAVAYDAILLDVDNGPAGMTRKANDGLYDAKGLRAAFAALRAGGVLAVWSSKPDATFTARLRKTGFAVVENPVRAKGPQGGAQHFIWTATRGA